MSSLDTYKLHEANRLSWNEATIAHNSHKRDQHIFLRDGGSTLYNEEKELLGNLAGLSVCHLQCNSGQDTLSLVSKLGAENPVGVDISDSAIEFATNLSKDSGLKATFIRSEVFEYCETTEPNQFDVVFVSYGALGWLCSMKRWAAGIQRILKPGGRLVLIEFHSGGMMFNDKKEHVYPYSSGGVPFQEDGVGDYVAWSASGTGEVQPSLMYEVGIEGFQNKHPSHEFCWGLADVLGPLTETGLSMTHFKEYPYSNFFKPFKQMIVEQTAEGPRYRNDGPMLPLMYSIIFKK
ncbi:hypothetical protein BGW38_002225 [Lunasporangiospora selenospora]|uniref:Methyltransferase domain-containing protein n=1 Tax=Lunasporangiospora selenospora TaxID=979761 RepID=A0A9P6FTJ4_9FUNG|nr:hypothetical protein BGW38_002225 [Lunasporangiospora selenospora]